MLPTLVAKLSGRGQKSKKGERRGGKRAVPTHMTPCQLTTSEGPPVDNALIHDLSPGGAGIVSEQGFEPGSIVNVLLVNANHTFAVSVEYKVIRCTRSPAGTYFLGG